MAAKLSRASFFSFIVDHHKDILHGEDCSACEKEQENHCQAHTFFFVFAINSATQSYCFVLYVFGLYLWIYFLNYLKLNVLSRIVSVQKMESVYRLNLLISLQCKSNDTAKN